MKTTTTKVKKLTQLIMLCLILSGKLFPFLENCKNWSEYHEKEAKKNETL